MNRPPLTNRRMMSLAALRNDRRGAALIEFAFVAPALIALILGVLSTGLQFFAQQYLETVTEQASRALLTGSSQQANQSQSQFKAAACAKLPSFMSCSKLIVDIQKSATFAAASTAAPSVTLDGNGNSSTTSNYAKPGPGEIVIVRMMYLWPNILGPLGLGSGNYGNQRLLVATSVFQTEPYS